MDRLRIWPLLSPAVYVLTAVLSFSATVFAQTPDRTYKAEYIRIVRQRMEETNEGTGLSSTFFTVGNPNEIQRGLQSYRKGVAILKGVAIDPQWLANYKSSEGPGGASGLTIPRDETDPYKRAYAGWIVLQLPLTSESDITTAFHEAIHLYHLFAFANPSHSNDDVDQPKDGPWYGGPEYISNGFSNTVKRLRTLDKEIDRVLADIASGRDTPGELDTLKAQIAMVRRQMAAEESDYPGFRRCLSNISGKSDWPGYDAALERKIEEARKQEIEAQVAALRTLRAKLANKMASIEQNAKKVAAAETKAKELLGKLKDLQTVVTGIEKICQQAAAKKNEIKAKVKEAGRLSQLAGDLADEASNLAVTCSSKETATAITDKYNEAIKNVRQIVSLRNEAVQANKELHHLKDQLAQAQKKLADGPGILSDIATQSTEADAALKSALGDFSQTTSLETQLAMGKQDLSLKLQKLKENYPGDLPADVDSWIRKLEETLAALKFSVGALPTQFAASTTNISNYASEAREIAQKYLNSVCVITPMDDEVSKIDDAAVVAGLALEASDLPKKAKECAAKADCLQAMKPIQLLLDQGDTEKASPLINQLKSLGCDTKDIADEYWRVQAKVWPLLARAREAFNNLAATCDYQAARKAAEDLQEGFPRHPWVVENLRNIQQGAMAQFEVNNLLQKAIAAEGELELHHVNINPLYLPTRQSNPAEADAAIAQAAQVAAPYPCLSKAVDKFKAQFEGNRSLADRIGSLRARVNELASKKASAQRNAQQAASFADQAAQLLVSVYALDDQISGIADKCRLASTLRASIESAARDGLAQEKAIRADLDNAIAKAANCTNKSDAADLQAKYNHSIRTVGQVGAAARATRQTNQGDLQSFLSDINNGKAAYQTANKLADRLAEACGKVSSALNAARADVQSGEALKANFASVAVGLRSEIDKLRTDYRPDGIATSLNHEINGLYALLHSALADSNNVSLEGIVSAAEAQATRCDGIRSSAQAQMQKYQNGVVCSVTPADDLVEQMDGVVAGLTVELAAAADAARQAAGCLKRLQPPADDKPPDFVGNTTQAVVRRPQEEPPDWVGRTEKGAQPVSVLGASPATCVDTTKAGTPERKACTEKGTEPLTADVLNAPKTVHVGDKVTMAGVGSGGVKPYNYQWASKNASTGRATARTPGSVNNSAGFQFNSEGQTAITLYVKDSRGNEAQKTVTVNVLGASPAETAAQTTCVDTTKPGTPERKACCASLGSDPNGRYFCEHLRRMNPTDAAAFRRGFERDSGGVSLLAWSGTWVADRTTYNISSSGNSISASFQYNFPNAYNKNARGSGQWSNCTIEGNTATCHFTISHEDDDKTANASGIVKVTLSGDTITGGTTVTESSINWKPRSEGGSSDLQKGGVGTIELKRAKP